MYFDAKEFFEECAKQSITAEIDKIISYQNEKRLNHTIDEIIETECNVWEEQGDAQDSVEIKERIKNYRVVPKMIEYWVGIDNNYFCCSQMIDDIANRLLEGYNATTLCNIKSLLSKINDEIFRWIDGNPDPIQKNYLFISKRFEIQNQWYLDQKRQSHTNEQYEEIINIRNTSKKLYNLFFKVAGSNDISTYEPALFGTIRCENGETLPDLLSIVWTMPSILFLTGVGGSGKTTHLKKLQYDMASLSSDRRQDNNYQGIDYIPIYISLSAMSQQKSIKQYISVNYVISDNVLSEYILTAVFGNKNSLLGYVFMLDGLNEYRGDIEDLFDEINAIRRNGNVKFIITSRYSYSDINISSDKLYDISEAVVEHISMENACRYFEIDEFPADYTEKTIELLTTPFYMKICKDSKFVLEAGVNINESLLMYNYLIANSKTHNHYDRIVNGFFPYLCYQSYRNDSVSEVNKSNGMVALSPFNSVFLKDEIESYLKIFGGELTYDNVESVLLNCSFIRKESSNLIAIYAFKHQNIRDIYAAYYVACIVWLIVESGNIVDNKYGLEVDMHAELSDFSNDVADALLAYEHDKRNFNLNNAYDGKSALFLLHDNNEYCKKLTGSNNLVVLQVLNKISVTREDNIYYAEKFITCYEASNNIELKNALANMYIFSLCQMAQHFRIYEDKSIEQFESFERCLKYATKAKEVFDNNSNLHSDGYNHVGKCLNSFMEFILNDCDDFSEIENDNSPLVNEAISNLLFANIVLRECNNKDNKIVSAVSPVLNDAYQAYDSYDKTENPDKRVLNILVLHYVSRAYLAKACLEKSAESLNLMAMILENNYNVKLRQKIIEKFGIEIAELTEFEDGMLELSYNLYDTASGCPHIVRSYSAQKKAIMLIKNQVNPKDVNKKLEIERDLMISKRANKPLTEYWYGRYYSDILKNKEMAKSHYECELTKRLQRKGLDSNTKINFALMLVLIELIPYRNITQEDLDFIKEILNLNIDSLDSFDIDISSCESGLKYELIYIIKCLQEQKQSIPKTRIEADKFWVTQETVEENLNRFLENLGTIINKSEV